MIQNNMINIRVREFLMNKVKSLLLGGALVMLATPAYAVGNWSTSVSKDEMTGKKSAYATSSTVTSTTPMDFPYKGTTAHLGIGCDEGSEWVYVGFSQSPNLQNTETKDGYNLIKTRVKWDDKVEETRLSQDWGAKFIHFRKSKKIISKIDNSNELLFELNWHGEGKVYFKWPLKGSSEALKKIRAACSK